MEYSGSALDGLDDDRLVQLVLQGQPDAFAAIIRRYQRDVTAVVSALLYRRQDTEELVQQVFVNAFTNLASFQTGRDFGSWIRTIARNAVREQLRKQVRYDRRLQVYYEMMAARLDDERTGADDRSREDALRRCLGQLTGKAAEVIRWRYTDSRELRKSRRRGRPRPTRSVNCSAGRGRRCVNAWSSGWTKHESHRDLDMAAAGRRDHRCRVRRT